MICPVNITADEDKETDNVLYSFPVLDNFHHTKDQPLVLELVPLPLLSDTFEQMPVGARGWYASAILSAMMMMAYSNGDHSLEQTGGFELMRDDLNKSQNKNKVFLELGSGTIGLAGMTMAWIAAQEQDSGKEHEVLLTDYDQQCLEQLDRNARGVQERLEDYFSPCTVPKITVGRLDWNEFDQDQSLILGTNITFVCGAALVYTEATAACADQVAKILALHAEAVVWIVQWPRGGWFQVFQQEILRLSNGTFSIQKFGPTDQLFSEEILDLARTLMPEAMQQESQLNIKDLRAVRIANAIEQNQ